MRFIHKLILFIIRPGSSTTPRNICVGDLFVPNVEFLENVHQPIIDSHFQNKEFILTL